jgi:serine/threonine-protein kinase
MAPRDRKQEEFPRKFGKYHLLGPLAQGGMGALYVAVTGDRGLEHLTVIKTVLPHLADPEYVARFRDEAKVVVKLSHGNLVPVFDAGQVGGELFLAMDFVEGKDLRAVWNRCAKKQVAFPVDIAVYIIKELCRGLGYAHSFGDLELVHRDVSPPNVLSSYVGEVKLTDFGLAASTLKLEKTAPGIIYGKVAYMSPEQARGEKLDGRSDLYAAGIILWELLTGRQLFPPGKDQPQDLTRRGHDPKVDPPSLRARRVEPDLDAVVLRALAPRREDRYQTGEAMREALAGWLARTHPTTDAARLGVFVTGLFAEDLQEDRRQREALIEKTRDRIQTLPPTDELRRMLEAAQRAAPNRAEDFVDRAAGTRRFSGGRRTGDGAEDGSERADRRGGDRPADRTRKGVAVDVPKPGPGGKTVVRADSSSGAVAVAEAPGLSLDPEDGTALLGVDLDGRYRVLDVIGEGGMGRVYLAEHIEIGRRVAVKVLHPVYGRMPELVERFRREARAASRIGHPNIVDVTDSGTTHDGSVYFVMELLDGVELAEVIDREGALDVTRALKIATQICRALSAAHAVGVIHRDLKPENVFLTVREGVSDFVKVLDFGIAKSAEAEEARAHRLTHPGMAMGTPEYMAPEQAAGQPADARTDVYAVGAILHEMLTGQPPYSGDNFMEILTKKATTDPPPPRALRPELAESVEHIVMRAMARDAQARLPSMEAFEYEITKCLRGRGAAVAKILGVSVAEEAPGDEERIIDQPPAFAGEGAAVEAATEMTISALAAAPWWRRRSGQFALGSVLAAALTIGIWIGVDPSRRAPANGVDPGGRGSRADDPTAAARRPEAPTSALAPAPAAADGAEVGPAVAEDGLAAADGGLAIAIEVGVASGAGAASPVEPRARYVGPPRTRAEARELLAEARTQLSKTQWGKARALYERVERGRHLRAEGLLGLAEVAFQTKEPDEAIRFASKALAAGGGDKARVLLGHAHYKKRQYGQAIGYYQEILKRNPNNKEAQQALKQAQKDAQDSGSP